jgi:hypothetical protein
MEQVYAWADTALRVVLASFFAITPGTLVWLAVLAVVLMARRVGRSLPTWWSAHGDQTA